MAITKSISAKANLKQKTNADNIPNIFNATPPGALMPFAGVNSPTGYLMCDGSAVSRTTYAILFGVIGTAYGAGDGATTFNIPDTRGYFLRGVDAGTGRDPDTASRGAAASGGNTGDAVGSVEGDTFGAHNHVINISDPGHVHQVPAQNGGGGANGFNYASGGTSFTEPTIGAGTGIGASSNNTGGSETRPKNLYVNYIIKI